MEGAVRYKVEVKKAEKVFKVPKAVLEELRGISAPKLLNSMKKEYVSCPVFAKDLPFLICFACPNFIRRVTGVVDCAGEQIRYEIADKI
jgi:hypothetical protein